MYKTVNKT